jgi:hypothetical protein
MKIPFQLMMVVLSGVLPGLAHGSSEEAWQKFRQTVGRECGEAVATAYGRPAHIEVNPFGSESYGAALVRVEEKAGESERLVCIYDKKAGSAELTAPFANPEN